MTGGRKEEEGIWLKIVIKRGINLSKMLSLFKWKLIFLALNIDMRKNFNAWLLKLKQQSLV